MQSISMPPTAALPVRIVSLPLQLDHFILSLDHPASVLDHGHISHVVVTTFQLIPLLSEIIHSKA